MTEFVIDDIFIDFRLLVALSRDFKSLDFLWFMKPQMHDSSNTALWYIYWLICVIPDLERVPLSFPVQHFWDGQADHQGELLFLVAETSWAVRQIKLAVVLQRPVQGHSVRCQAPSKALQLVLQSTNILLDGIHLQLRTMRPHSEESRPLILTARKGTNYSRNLFYIPLLKSINWSESKPGTVFPLCHEWGATSESLRFEAADIEVPTKMKNDIGSNHPSSCLYISLGYMLCLRSPAVWSVALVISL